MLLSHDAKCFLLFFLQAKAVLSRNTVPVPGSPLPPDPKNANISITLSHTILKTIVTQSAKQSSVKVSIIHGPWHHCPVCLSLVCQTLRVTRWKYGRFQNILSEINSRNAMRYIFSLNNHIHGSLLTVGESREQGHRRTNVFWVPSLCWVQSQVSLHKHNTGR